MSLKVLVLSRNYPNNVLPYLGLWVEGLVSHTLGVCELRVMAPVPYCPPLPHRLVDTRFRQIALQQCRNGVRVSYPRFLTGPGYSLHSSEARTYYWGIRRQVARLRQEFPFDVIHAHFTYPDGVVAAWLGRHYRVPVVITEHAPWQPWMEDYPRVRRQAVWAAHESTFHIAVSHSVRATIAYFTGESAKLRVIPVGVDGSVFTPPPDSDRPSPTQVLYVGRINFIKGLDVLLRAMRQLVNRRRDVRLVVVGGSFYRHARPQEEQIYRLAQTLGVGEHVAFVGMKAPHEVADLMRRSALLVVPGRAESFGAVLVEALACGTPVVATRCGGPEDIVHDQVGLLVPKEDVDALALAIDRVLSHRERYNAAQLRAYALENFAWEQIARRTVTLYAEALERFHTPPGAQVERAIKG